MEMVETPIVNSKAPVRASRTIEDVPESTDKYRRYEKEYLRRINHKYFSGVTLSGEPIFESSAIIDGFVFKESKDPPLKKFTEGQNSVEDHGKTGAHSADAGPPPSWKNVMRKA